MVDNQIINVFRLSLCIVLTPYCRLPRIFPLMETSWSSSRILFFGESDQRGEQQKSYIHPGWGNLPDGFKDTCKHAYRAQKTEETMTRNSTKEQNKDSFLVGNDCCCNV